MIAIGQGADRKVAAVVADMNQPLGHAIGNALEVKEAIEVLQGGGPDDLRAHCLTVGGLMLVLANRAPALAEARQCLAQALDSGDAWQKFLEWITAQGGDAAVVEEPALLPSAPLVEDLPSPQDGYIAEINAHDVGLASVLLGAGREKKGDPIDPAVGIVLHVKVGAAVRRGEHLLTIHANDVERLALVRRQLLEAFRWSDTPSPPPAHAMRIIQ